IRLETYRMDMILEGADPDPRITAEGRSTDYTNYYTHDALDVHTYTRIIYHDVYPGIDWVMYTTENGLKYDFVVHPGADPDRIRLRFKHHEELRLDNEGRLIHGNRLGRFTEEGPLSFQNGIEIPTHFDLEGDLLTFTLGNYDPGRTLTIDPARIWATYYGGTELDEAYSCTTDPSGNVYIAGLTASTSDIADGGYQNTYGGSNYDAFLVKFDPAGTRLWATYYGGTELDGGLSCATDPGGNVYLAGTTASSSDIADGGHQNTFGSLRDAFLVKFDLAGTRLWATYYGGTDYDEGYSCAVDPSGNVYLSGYTGSTSDIASGGHQNTIGSVWSTDAFLVKFDPAGTRLWATYYGGVDEEEGLSCAVDPSGNVYLAGSTWSDTSIASGGHQNANGGAKDAFLVKFDPPGTRLWGTYYGVLAKDGAGSCAVDPEGNVYLAGYTGSPVGMASGGYQNTSGGMNDAFLAKFDPAGTRLWATYYGGSGDELALFRGDIGITTDPQGDVYLASLTSSTTGISSGGFQNTYGGGANDAYLVKFDPAGTRLWATYYGGTEEDRGHSCAVDPSGNVYLAGYAQSTADIASGGHQNTFGGSRDGFLVKFDAASGIGIAERPPSPTTAVAIPNPTSGLLMITTAATRQRLVIRDATGRTVLEGVLLTHTAEVDLSSEPAGLYMLRVWNEEGAEMIRIFKE
ncbi:MAG: SBBP repeat-containing protein, partial [Flavobacteriales bacterium]